MYDITLEDCNNLKEITLPKYLKTIDSCCFAEFSNLTTIHFNTNYFLQLVIEGELQEEFW